MTRKRPVITANTSSPRGAKAWAEIRVCVPVGWDELVAEELERVTGAAAAVGATDPGEPPPRPGFTLVRAWVQTDSAGSGTDLLVDLKKRLAALALESGCSELADLTPHAQSRVDEQWGSLWRESWKPFRIGRLCVVPPGFRDLRQADIPLVLEPGCVFGTGRHVTTRTCLRVLQDRVRAGDRVLDVGTGTGILAVASALLGAAQAVGFDVDPGSEPAARELADTNHVAHRCSFRTGGIETVGAGERGFDGLFANVYADVIHDLASELVGCLRAGGWMCCSGIEQRHSREVQAALEKAGAKIVRMEERRRWVSVTALRENG